MRLSSTDIKRVKRLSLRETKLPKKQETPVEVITAPQSPFNEEIVYNTMKLKYPLLEALVASFDLVLNKPEQGAEIKPQPVDRNKLKGIAEEIFKRNNSYTREEVIYRIQENTKIDRSRAERGFNLMIQEGIIETTQEIYYLGGSAPF
jgi:hypothetical protein